MVQGLGVQPPRTVTPDPQETQSFDWHEATRLLRQPALRNLWLAQVVSQLGDGMFTVGIVLAILDRTNSGTALALTVIAQFLPYIFLGIVAGALVDRWERRRTMVLANTFCGCLLLILPILDRFGLLHPASYAVVAFLLTTGDLFFDPAKNALVATLVPQEDLARTNAFLASTQQFLSVGGPAVAGLLIATAGVNGVFLADGASFFLAALILSHVPHASPEVAPRPIAEAGGAAKEPLWVSIRAGLTFIRNDRLLRLIVGVGSALNFFLSPLPILIPIFFKQKLNAHPALFGVAISVIFVGFLVGAVLVGTLGSQIGIGWMTISAVLLAAIATGLFALTPPVPIVLLLALAGGVAIGTLGVCETTVIQANAPDAMRGRVSAVYTSVSQGGRAIAVAASGILADTFGSDRVFLGVSILVGLCALLLVRSPTIRATR